MTEQQFYRQVGEQLIEKLKAFINTEKSSFSGLSSYELEYYNNSEYDVKSTMITMRRIVLRQRKQVDSVPDFGSWWIHDLPKHGIEGVTLKDFYFNHNCANLYLDFSGYMANQLAGLSEELTTSDFFKVEIFSCTKTKVYKTDWVPVEAPTLDAAKRIANEKLFGSGWHVNRVESCSKEEFDRLIKHVEKASKRKRTK